ncbi:MAG: 6-hydroxymethylpterin diphosphokinase MptE-like protein [Halobacteriaceae archaeon]
MEFEEWEPAYEAIRREFGFDRSADRRARDVLGALVGPFDRDRLAGLTGATVGIVGAAPSLSTELERLAAVDRVVAASSAVPVLARAGITVDLMVTDLDKTPETARGLTERGTPVAVHAHGDNIPLLEAQVPTFETANVLPTTQVRPGPPVENFGGFTDGDRGAFIADDLGAATLRFVGWDFEDPSATRMKRQKLWWAARLLRWLELRRSERYAVLDGYRDRVELPWLE